MVTVKRANVILTIEDDEVEKYYEKGYSILDAFGNVVKEGAPKEIGALQKLLQEKESEITTLKKEIERLKAENEVLILASSQVQEKRPYTKKKTQEQ